MSQSEVARLLGLHPSRVSQIEKSAMAKLRKGLLAIGIDAFWTAYVVHALSEHKPEYEPKRDRREYDHQRWLRRKAKKEAGR